MNVTSSKTFSLLLPSMWGMVTVSLMRLGCSVSSVPVYLSFAEKGSAPTVPATRGWHIPATVPYTNKHQTFCFPEKFLHRKFFYVSAFCHSKDSKYCSRRAKCSQHLFIVLKLFHERDQTFHAREWVALTLLHADGHDGATELQAFIPIHVHAPRCTLDPGTSLEVDWVQCDDFGGGEEGIEVNLSQRTGDTIRAGGGTNKPTITSQGVVDVLAYTDGACFVIIWVLWVTSLEERKKKMLVRETNLRIAVAVKVSSAHSWRALQVADN